MKIKLRKAFLGHARSSVVELREENSKFYLDGTLEGCTTSVEVNPSNPPDWLDFPKSTYEIFDAFTKDKKIEVLTEALQQVVGIDNYLDNIQDAIDYLNNKVDEVHNTAVVEEYTMPVNNVRD